MFLKIALLCVVGLAADIWFIKTEYAGKMGKATVLKGLASLFFVILGLVCYVPSPTPFGRLIVIGLVLGLLGDVLLNMRNLYEGKKSMKVFALGILAFLSGHFLYIAALLGRDISILVPAALMTAVLTLLAVPPLMKRITAPSKGLRIFGWVYLIIVIYMFSCSAMLLYNIGANALTLLFAAGGLLFMVSDFIMIYYSFGKKIKPLRAINLLSYYVGQLLIAVSILYS